MAENNVINEDTTESFSSVRIKPFSILSTKTRVENPHDDTQVFIEVQLRAKSHVYLTRNDILSAARRTTVKIFPINLVDLFASDIFCNGNLETLLAMDILDDSSSNLGFRNFFKRVVSRYGNKMANLCLKIKRSVVIIVFRLELVNIIKKRRYFLTCRLQRLNRIAERRLKGNVDEIQEEIRLSMLEIVDIRRFNENDDSGSDKDECVICLDEFKKEISHQVHNRLDKQKRVI
ncbi:hypothetical protein MKW98_024391 [Papaver atlanticum]|uniref:Uncharacterized protein n=1 Tax=Papaver atlanticum TaxID=357466 RepID=A0AAD4XLK8_9MAGN|nr:hypothetical protein MKW98_024391 [Papaver atlanticum]